MLLSQMNILLELQVPKYIYPQDNFTITCRARRPLNIMVNHCSIMSRSIQREKDGGFSLTFLVAHAEKACEVKCLTKEQKITKKVLVIGEDI